MIGRDAAPPRLDVAADAPRLAQSVAPEPGLRPAPVAQRVFEGWGLRAGCEGGEGVGRACVAPELVWLGDVVEGAVAVVVFYVVEAAGGPGCEVLDLVADGAGVADAGPVAVVGVGAGGDAEGFECCGEVSHTVGEFLRVCGGVRRDRFYVRREGKLPATKLPLASHYFLFNVWGMFCALRLESYRVYQSSNIMDFQN